MPSIRDRLTRTDWGLRLGILFGGSLGSAARHLLTSLNNATLPWGTLIVNLVGSGVLGYLTGRIRRHPQRRFWLGLGGVGVLGAFTTFGAFISELILLLDDGKGVVAVLYAFASVALGLGLARLGHRIGAIV